MADPRQERHRPTENTFNNEMNQEHIAASDSAHQVNNRDVGKLGIHTYSSNQSNYFFSCHAPHDRVSTSENPRISTTGQNKEPSTTSQAESLSPTLPESADEVALPSGGLELHEDKAEIPEERHAASRRRKWTRKHSLVAGIILLAIIVVVAVVAGVLIGHRNKQTAGSTTSSGTLDTPTLNSTSTTFGQVASSSTPSATPTTFCASSRNCQAPSSSSSESSWPLPAKSSAQTTSQAAIATTSTSRMPVTATSSALTSFQAAVTTPPTTRMPTSATTPVSCTTHSNCPTHQECDMSASICFFCTYATGGMRCSGDVYNCCSPWQCIAGFDTFSTCTFIS